MNAGRTAREAAIVTFREREKMRRARLKTPKQSKPPKTNVRESERERVPDDGLSVSGRGATLFPRVGTLAKKAAGLPIGVIQRSKDVVGDAIQTGVSLVEDTFNGTLRYRLQQSIPGLRSLSAVENAIASANGSIGS